MKAILTIILLFVSFTATASPLEKYKLARNSGDKLQLRERKLPSLHPIVSELLKNQGLDADLFVGEWGDNLELRDLCMICGPQATEVAIANYYVMSQDLACKLHLRWGEDVIIMSGPSRLSSPIVNDIDPIESEDNKLIDCYEIEK